MKASKCLKKPGDVARRKSDGSVAMFTDRGCGLSRMLMDGNVENKCGLYDDLHGDDWEPLLPASEVEELRAENERLNSRCDMLRDTAKRLRHAREAVMEERDQLRSELAEAKKPPVLGEPLEEGEPIPIERLVWAYDEATDMLWPEMWGVKTLVPHGSKRYLDPRPVPAVPEPDVPSLLERIAIARCSSCQCGKKTPIWKYHKSNCRYRVLCEAEEALGGQDDE